MCCPSQAPKFWEISLQIPPPLFSENMLTRGGYLGCYRLIFFLKKTMQGEKINLYKDILPCLFRRSRRAQRLPPEPIRAARRARAGPAVPNGVPSASRAREGRVRPAVERSVGRRSPLAGRIPMTLWEDPAGSPAAARAQCLPAGIVDHRHGR